MRFNHREHRDSFDVPSVHGNKAGLCIVNGENLPGQKRSSTSNSRWHEGKREGKTNGISSRFTSRFRAFAVPVPAVTEKARLCALCGSNLAFSIFLAFLLPLHAHAHPMVENALDVVIGRDKILIDARISMEQILIASAKPGATPTREQWPQLARDHADYILHHLQIRSDGRLIPGKTFAAVAVPTTIPATSVLIPSRFEYLLDNPPRTVRIDQNFLREFDLWSASCIVRIRQSDDATFSTALLTRENSAVFDCVWTTALPGISTGSTRTEIKLGQTIRAYLVYGIMHILTGYDHLLFAGALVLATTRFSDLIKVVTAFTAAHTLTLMLSVCNLVSLSGRIVEPMIAASIVVVAVQNISSPKQSRGWTRLAIAFSFGLFHGLGFAGGLKEAMTEMPRIALWTALCAFSLGVELGHQVVVLPLFLGMKWVRQARPDPHGLLLSTRLVKFGSSAIAMAGVYFLIQAFR